MAEGIIIHVEVGQERRTEYFGEEFIRIGSAEVCELQIHTAKIPDHFVWLGLERIESGYRVTEYSEKIDLMLNGEPVRGFVTISDGDKIEIDSAGIEFSFFSLNSL